MNIDLKKTIRRLPSKLTHRFLMDVHSTFRIRPNHSYIFWRYLAQILINKNRGNRSERAADSYAHLPPSKEELDPCKSTFGFGIKVIP